MRLIRYVKSVTYVFIFLSLSSNAKGESCEAARATAIQNAADTCSSPGNNYCTPSEPLQYTKYCIHTSGIFLRRFAESSGLGHRLICPYSWTYDTFYPDVPSTHESGTSEMDVAGIWDCTNVEPQTGANSPPNSCQKSGSIVHIDTQSLSEDVPIAGASFCLVYASKLQDGRTADYKFNIPISGNTPRDAIQSFVVETRRDGDLIDSASFQNNLPNQSYEYIWNGLDSTNSNELKSQKFDITFKETYSSGTYPSL